MREIVNRLHENRQIDLAKSILEANGYKVTKKSEEGKSYNIREITLDSLSNMDKNQLKEYLSHLIRNCSESVLSAVMAELGYSDPDDSSNLKASFIEALDNFGEKDMRDLGKSLVRSMSSEALAKAIEDSGHVVN